VLTAADLTTLRAAIPGETGLVRLLDTLRARVARTLTESPPVPKVKALLTRDGGVCPDDGAPLGFDPWSPESHRCPRCGKAFTGERHHRHWARPQHLWLAERAADLALIAAVGEEEEAEAAASRALELIGTYEALYFALPNRDNVLGPSHLFFSTYLESLWITSYLGAAFLLQEAGRLSDQRVEGINHVADEAAALIGDFNEGLSNRQTWHAAALTAIAAWFGDEELARTAVESRTGLLGHLADGFGEDGLWWEGENYHLFALRGVMQGIGWARVAGYDLLEDPELRQHFRAALLGPTRSALPDFTFPARRDARYGVSLAQPAYLELWEIGRTWLRGDGDAEIDAWLAALYALPAPPAEQYDAWLHDAARPHPARRTRGDLSWWVFAAWPTDSEAEKLPTDFTEEADGAVVGEAGTAAPDSAPAWHPESALLPGQGLAILRSGGRYASLECGPAVGGHGHPDRLHLAVHAGGIHWLPDLGTGSYVTPTLAWYRSALAHNAPRLDGVNAGGEDAWCEAFDAAGEFAWCRGRAGKIQRTLVAGPSHLLDMLEIETPEEGEIDLPWHPMGEWRVESPGRWEPAALEHPFVSSVERFVRMGGGGDGGPHPLVVEACTPDPRPSPTGAGGGHEPRVLRAFFIAPEAEFVRALAPGDPTTGEPQPFLLVRAHAAAVRWVTVLDWSAGGARSMEDPAAAVVPDAAMQAVKTARVEGDLVEVDTPGARYRYRVSETGLTIEDGDRTIRLAGLRRAPARHEPFFEPRLEPDAEAFAPLIPAPPALDGTLDGFDTSAPLTLDHEHQYRRSEEPWDPERFSAEAWINRDHDALYLAVAVRKPDLIFRPAGARPLELDNEPDDIHSDGLQVYLRRDDAGLGVLAVPEEGGAVRVREIDEDAEGTGGGAADRVPGVTGRWAPTDDGYLVTLRIEDPRIGVLYPGMRLGFDLLVNEMLPGRERRAGQLVWSGGAVWVYLQGDRHDPSRFGVLVLG
jgi:hypothetical protein